SQPDMEGHWLAVDVFRDSPGRLELSLLHDVGRVDTRSHPLIHPELDYTEQVAPMAVQQPIESASVALPDLIKQAANLCVIDCDWDHASFLSVAAPTHRS